ncbi:MAG: NAD(+)/NADH kinase [Deltaproteobacteria bacterium]|nr:NAD(+)/NADH kinase [Deltaproteobacteria bacterium]
MRDVLVVYKRSSFELYAASPDAAVQAYMRSGSPDVDVMRRSHDAQARALETVTGELGRRGVRCETIFRADLRPIAGRDLVVAVGGDGTFLEVSHYVTDATLLGVNSDPGGSTGFFCCATAESFGASLDALDQLPRTALHRVEMVRDGVRLPELVLNDVLYAHANPAATSRYRIVVDGRTTTHRSSGLLVCTAAGSSAWMYQEGGALMPLDAPGLQYCHRGERSERPARADAVAIHSLTRQGTLYVDGPHLTYECGLGCEVLLRGGRPLRVVGDLAAKRAALG